MSERPFIVRLFIPGSSTELISAVIGAAALALGIFVFTYQLKMKKSLATWVKTEATVIGKVYRYGSSGGRGSETIGDIAVPYKFTVNGKSYSGKRHSFGGNRTSAELVAAKRKYVIGSRVTVFYDPKDPTLSAMDISTDSHLLGLFMLIIGSLGFVGSTIYRLISGGKPKPLPTTYKRY